MSCSSFGPGFWGPHNLTPLANWTSNRLGKTQKLHWQMVCQVTHAQRQDWVALWNKPIWILLSPEHPVSVILWKVSILSIRARLECWLMSALDDNWMQHLKLEEEDSLPSAVQSGEGWAQRESHSQHKPHIPRSGYLKQRKQKTKDRHFRKLCRAF